MAADWRTYRDGCGTASSSRLSEIKVRSPSLTSVVDPSYQSLTPVSMTPSQPNDSGCPSPVPAELPAAFTANIVQLSRPQLNTTRPGEQCVLLGLNRHLVYRAIIQWLRSFGFPRYCHDLLTCHDLDRNVGLQMAFLLCGCLRPPVMEVRASTRYVYFSRCTSSEGRVRQRSVRRLKVSRPSPTVLDASSDAS